MTHAAQDRPTRTRDGSPQEVQVSSADPPLPRLGRFEVRQLVGEGAFGRVYEAVDPALGRRVALKVARPEQLTSPARIRRFQREARAAAALSHPNIVGVFDVGREGSYHYIAMTFVPGISLESALQEREGRPLSAREAALLACKLAEALAYAHRCGVVHRDVKPGNVLLDEQGEPHLADFGLAARTATAGAGEPDLPEDRLTEAGVPLGTWAYMAPEQWRGETTPSGDQYSLG
jgi:serine/threonine protein kinase